jgi:hypothetical protein
MQWRKVAQLGLLVAIAVALAALNVWIAAQRSTIPLQLDARVTSREVRREKHPGKDDVHLLHLEPFHALHVDGDVYASVTDGDRLRKEAWSRTLQVNDKTLPLVWSRDARGMLVAMPLVLLILLATAAWVPWVRIDDGNQ